VWSQVSSISEDVPAYTARLSELWEKSNNALDQIEQRTVAAVIPKSLRAQNDQIQQKPQEAAARTRKRRGATVPVTTPAPPAIQEVRLHTEPKPIITTMYFYLSGYFHILVMASFVPFLVYFMLSWRDHISKSVMRIFQGHEHRVVVGRTWTGIGDSTRAYVLGNFLLWVFLSSVSAIAFFLLGVPYWPLVGPLSAFFSLAPYVGLPLSVIPPVMAAVAIPNGFKIILTVVAVTVGLHFITMNFLYAKIIGRRVRLNPLMVTIAIMFWGLIWGGIGLILAVPITAALKTICDNVESLQPYGKLLGD
jgi:predicted PurR-regulated permease PerM